LRKRFNGVVDEVYTAAWMPMSAYPESAHRRDERGARDNFLAWSRAKFRAPKDYFDNPMPMPPQEFA
jgi:hypothetical protein